MRAHFSLPSVASEEVEGRPPISVKFEIPYFTTSGLQVSNIFYFSFNFSFFSFCFIENFILK